MKSTVLNKVSLAAKFVNADTVSLTIRDLSNGQIWVYNIQFRQTDHRSVAEQVIDELVNDGEDSPSEDANEVVNNKEDE